MIVLKYQPTCEQEVIALFCSIIDKLDLRIIRLRTSFPDCIAENIKSGEKIRIEFEFMSDNVNPQKHNHDLSKCDCVICWVDDADPPIPVKVIELSNMSEFKNLPVNQSVARTGKDISRRIIIKAQKELGLSLNDFTDMINEFHPDVRSSEARLLIARMIAGKGKPYVENGRLYLQEKPDFKNHPWAVAKYKDLLKKADDILIKFGYIVE